MKIKIECEIEVDEMWTGTENEDLVWFISLLDNEEGMTNVRLWSNEIGDEIGVTSNFKYKIL
jgi:hypothetical protein